MAPFRPAALCVLSAEGVDDRKSIELWLSLHTNYFFPLSNICVRTELDYQSDLGLAGLTLGVRTKAVIHVSRAQPPCLLVALPFTSHQLYFFTFPLVIIIILGNSICCNTADNPREWKIQSNNLLLLTHLQAQQDLGAENNGWALAALRMLLDHFLSDR